MTGAVAPVIGRFQTFWLQAGAFVVKLPLFHAFEASVDQLITNFTHPGKFLRRFSFQVPTFKFFLA